MPKSHTRRRSKPRDDQRDQSRLNERPNLGASPDAQDCRSYRLRSRTILTSQITKPRFFPPVEPEFTNFASKMPEEKEKVLSVKGVECISCGNWEPWERLR